jgi:hypothetical protein
MIVAFTCARCSKTFKRRTWVGYAPKYCSKKCYGHTKRPLLERFWEKVEITPSCWLWTGGKMSNGYGMIVNDTGHKVPAHRAAYEFLVGPIPKGLDLDHLCRVRHCVNPEHLEPVTRGENLKRGLTGNNMQGRTHCKRGHELSGNNVYFAPNRLTVTGERRRECRACQRIRNSRRSEV